MNRVNIIADVMHRFIQSELHGALCAQDKTINKRISRINCMCQGQTVGDSE